MTVGRVRLAWNGWREGPRAPLALLLDDARSGRTRIGHGFVALDFVAVLHGRASLLAVHASDADIAVRPAASGSPARVDYSHLREVEIDRSTVAFDGPPDLSCRAGIDLLLLDARSRAAAIGVSGRVAASLSCGGPAVALRGAGSVLPDGGIAWRLDTAPLVPAAFARVTPRLAALGGLDLPVTLSVRTMLAGDRGLMLPHRLDFTALLGAGSIRMAATDPSGLPIASGRIRLSVDLPDETDGPMRAAMPDATLVLAGPEAPTVSLDGVTSIAGNAIGATLDARIARFDFAGLQRYWPSALASGGRRWVSGNITAGAGRNLAIHTTLASTGGLAGLHVTALSGGLDASGLTLFWLRPIAPLHGMDARLVLDGPDGLRIDASRALQDVSGHGQIAVGPTTMHIAGLSHKDQTGRIETRLQGALPDVLALLADPRLRLLSRHPLPFKDPAGSVDGRLTVSLPLTDAVRIRDVAIHADAAVTDVHLGSVAAGRDLDAGDLTFAADNAGLALHGTGRLAAIPSTLAYSMDFRAGGPQQSTERAHVDATVDAAAVRSQGLDSAHRFTGSALAGLDYDHHRDGSARIAMRLDLAPAGIVLPGWGKPAGAPAQASGALVLQDGHLTAIEALHAEGPSLSLDGHSEVGQGRPRALVLERFSLGRSRGSGRIDLPTPGRSLRVMLRGPVLDLAPFLAGGSDQAGSSDAGWRADIAFRKVLLGGDREFGSVTLRAQGQGGTVTSGRLGVVAPALTATLSPEAGGRRLLADVPDAGAVLRALQFGERIDGGAIRLDGLLEDRATGTGAPGTRLEGLATIGPFAVADAPLAARVARDLSIYGFVHGQAGRQLSVTRAEIPFVLQGGTLTLTGAQASNAALGATLRGIVDFRRDVLDLRGTVVPSYLLNAIPGKLPGVGRVFSPEKGGGLLAITLRITGAMDKPVVRANPLSLLAPGILRRLLFD